MDNRIIIGIICAIAAGTGSYMMYNAITEQQYAEQQVSIDKERLSKLTEKEDSQRDSITFDRQVELCKKMITQYGDAGEGCKVIVGVSS